MKCMLVKNIAGIFLLIYYIDKRTDTLTYKQFYEVCSDADAERMKSLGLEQFVKTE